MHLINCIHKMLLNTYEAASTWWHFQIIECSSNVRLWMNSSWKRIECINGQTASRRVSARICMRIYENKWEVEMNEKITKHHNGEHIRCHWPIENRKRVNGNTFQAILAYIKRIWIKLNATSDDEKNKLNARTKRVDWEASMCGLDQVHIMHTFPLT